MIVIDAMDLVVLGVGAVVLLACVIIIAIERLVYFFKRKKGSAVKNERWDHKN